MLFKWTTRIMSIVNAHFFYITKGDTQYLYPTRFNETFLSVFGGL